MENKLTEPLVLFDNLSKQSKMQSGFAKLIEILCL